MRIIQKFLLAISMGFMAMTVGASPTNPVSGVDYRMLAQPQPTDSGKKVEVTEFFWYACPHCNVFDPGLNDWVKKQGDNIVFKRVPVAFREDFIPQQRLYYTLEELGLVDKLHSKVFQAIHGGRQALATDAAIFDFIEKQGVDKKKFVDMYKSFSVKTKVDRAVQLQQAYNVDGVPMVAIDGRYVTSPSIVGVGMGRQSEKALEDATLQVMSALVAKAANEKKAAPEAKAASKTTSPTQKK